MHVVPPRIFYVPYFASNGYFLGRHTLFTWRSTKHFPPQVVKVRAKRKVSHACVWVSPSALSWRFNIEFLDQMSQARWSHHHYTPKHPGHTEGIEFAMYESILSFFPLTLNMRQILSFCLTRLCGHFMHLHWPCHSLRQMQNRLLGCEFFLYKSISLRIRLFSNLLIVSWVSAHCQQSQIRWA